jgi:hypothetical protein
VIKIWYQPESGAREVVDTAATAAEADRLVAEYRLAFGCAAGGHRFGKDRVWYFSRPGRTTRFLCAACGRELGPVAAYMSAYCGSCAREAHAKAVGSLHGAD